jgi:hypothetical protein
MNDTATPAHVWPGMRIHAIDIVQPPAIGIPVVGMDEHHRMVSTTLTAKSSAETP